MKFHYAWLVWSSVFLIPWIVLYALYPRHRIAMRRTSAFMALFGLTEPLCNNKVDATAAVINELATQRKAMRDHMMAMGPQMMQHMMHHAHMGMMEGMMKSMSGCPMMQPAGSEQPKHH